MVVDISMVRTRCPLITIPPFVPLEMDEYSRLIPAVNRFPSAKDGKGFKPLADEVQPWPKVWNSYHARHSSSSCPSKYANFRNRWEGTRYCYAKLHLSLEYRYVRVNPNAKGAQEYYNSLFNLYAQWGLTCKSR